MSRYLTRQVWGKISARFNPPLSQRHHVLIPSRCLQTGTFYPVSHTPGSSRRMRIVVGITGATGAALAVRSLEIMREFGVETHTGVSKWGDATLRYETDYNVEDLRGLSTKIYSVRDLSAPISSGSYETDGMLIAPCSMKTLAAIRIGFSDDLISRTADVCLNERCKLMMAVREIPLSSIHLENMLSLTQAGAIIFPPVPAYHHRPQTVEDIIQQSVGRMLDNFGIATSGFERWKGFQGRMTRH